MKKQLSAILLGTSLFLASAVNPLSVSASTASFKDMKGHWAESSVKQASEKGFIGGYSDNTFRPKNLVTRAEFATFLTRAIKVDSKTSKEPFSDVADTFWARHSIEKGIALGFIKPSEYANNKFEPNKAMTRAEIARWLVNGLESANPAYKDVRTTLATSPHTLIPIPEFYKNLVKKTDLPYIGVTMGTGLLGGYNDGTFKTNGTTTRAEVAAILLRLVNTIEKTPGSYKGLNELVEVAETGTNLTTATSWNYLNDVTIKDVINKPITYKNKVGTAKVKRVIFVDANNFNEITNSIYGKMFLDQSSWYPKQDLSVFLEREFTSHVDVLDIGPYAQGTIQSTLSSVRITSDNVIKKYGLSTIANENFYTFFKKSQPKTYWTQNALTYDAVHSIFTDDDTQTTFYKR